VPAWLRSWPAAEEDTAARVDAAEAQSAGAAVCARRAIAMSVVVWWLDTAPPVDWGGVGAVPVALNATVTASGSTMQLCSAEDRTSLESPEEEEDEPVSAESVTPAR
jgi:hypothetical protein